jgi:hypothetical protein
MVCACACTQTFASDMRGFTSTRQTIALCFFHPFSIARVVAGLSNTQPYPPLQV